jgi:hypothetical protein
MQAIEVETEIDENHEIHIRLPAEVGSGKARVVVLYEETGELPASAGPRPVRLGLFQGQAQLEDMALVSADGKFADYPLDVIW